VTNANIDATSIFVGSDLVEHVPAETLNVYRAAVRRLNELAAAERTRVRSERAAAAAAGRNRGGLRPTRMLHDILAGQLRRLIKDPLQCGACGFGPIDHVACSDLTTHHLESGGGGGPAVIDNSCPRCGWFQGDKAAWPRWDGTLPAELAACCPNKPVLLGQDDWIDCRVKVRIRILPARLLPVHCHDPCVTLPLSSLYAPLPLRLSACH
jgi:hypothetical protein